jgi:uracil-DNA glycosylase family 4
VENQLRAFTKESRQKDFFNSIQYCSLCPRLCGRMKVLSETNGNINSKVLFIAEAPGRLGAEKTGIPLYGDKTGDNFELLLNNVSWKRDDIFITNSILCNPQNEDGNNSSPSSDELQNCSYYLEMTINLVRPDVIVTLGVTALKALSLIQKHKLNLSEHVAQVYDWNGYKIFPLYHPGPRALIHRSLIKQRSDFIVLSKIVHPSQGLLKGKEYISSKATILKETIKDTALEDLVKLILLELHNISFFKLTKLLYLVDLEALRSIGNTLSGTIYLRQQEGPWIPDLKKVVSILQAQNYVTLSFRNKTPFVSIKGAINWDGDDFDTENMQKAKDVVHQFGSYTDSQIKTCVYATPPMKYILREEAKGRDMRKIPVIYKDKTSAELDIYEKS